MTYDYKTDWKELANNKANTAAHHFQYCILKALFAKSNNKLEIAKALLKKAFTPKSNGTWDTLSNISRRVFYRNNVFLGKPLADFLTEEQQRQYKALVWECTGMAIRQSEEDYLFVFVRQDISNEQQAVQAAHATHKAGHKFPSNPDETYFVLIGVEDECQLQEVELLLQKHNHEYVSFMEPDLGNTMTAIAVKPMKEHQKRFLKKYKKLQF